MSARKPPALANWLLDRFGLARQNPPLAGDLLEEFRSGRSAAWYWRQTLVAVFTCLSQNARNSRRHLTGAVMGWAAQVGITFVLWRLQFPPRLPHGRSVDLWVALSSSWVTMVITVGLAVALNKGSRELKRRSSDPEGRLMSACDQFAVSFPIYCFMAMMGMAVQWGFAYSQAILFAYWIIWDLIPSVVFAKRKKP